MLANLEVRTWQILKDNFILVYETQNIISLSEVLAEARKKIRKKIRKNSRKIHRKIFLARIFVFYSLLERSLQDL